MKKISEDSILLRFNKESDAIQELEDCRCSGTCEWIKAFDNHFNIGCANKTNERANMDFKGKGARWDFKYCPYCGNKIKERTYERDRK